MTKKHEELVEEIYEQLGAMTSTLVRYRERGDKEAAHEWKLNVAQWLITLILSAVRDGRLGLDILEELRAENEALQKKLDHATRVHPLENLDGLDL